MSLSATKMPLVAACVAVGLVAQARGATVSAPYSAFTGLPSDPGASDFVSNTGGGTTNTWAAQPSGAWQHTVQTDWGGAAGSTQAVLTSGIAGSGFTMSTDFSVSNRPDAGSPSGFQGANIGMIALATDTSLSNNDPSNWYFVQVHLSSWDWGANAAGKDSMTIWKSSLLPSWDTWDGATSMGAQSLGSNVNMTDKYRLSVAGTYDAGGSLVLAATVTDLTTSSLVASLTTSSIASPSGGAYFGYRDGADANSFMTADYSNFSLQAVPEPMSLGLLGVASLGLIARRRRSA